MTNLYLLTIIPGFMLLRLLKYWFEFNVSQLVTQYFKTPKEVSYKESDTNSVTIVRAHGGKDEKDVNIYTEKVDAVLDLLCSLDSAKHVRIDTRYSLNTTEEIDLTSMLKARVIKNGERGVEVVLYSEVMKVGDIRNWIDDIHMKYSLEKNNKLGNRMYYFNEIAAEPAAQQEMMPDGTMKKTYRWENIPKTLTFSINEFKTNKSFTNVYGHHVNELKERLDLFMNRPDWYTARGIPHSLGILLHGVPGAGKTSTIKAIAKDTQRHIFNLSLRAYTTQKQLTNLFFNETVQVNGYDGLKHSYKIPLNRRVYVIEDIDCLTDVVLDRSLRPSSFMGEAKEGEAVTLSFLLNLMDGVLETPGRILIITSNYPDALDRAFIRPGRIDVKIAFTNASREFILDMVNRFYTVSKSLEYIPAHLDGVFTPAEVMESLCMNFKNVDAALTHLENKRILMDKLRLEMSTGTRIEDIESTHTKPILQHAAIKHTDKPNSDEKVSLEQVPDAIDTCSCKDTNRPCIHCLKKQPPDTNWDKSVLGSMTMPSANYFMEADFGDAVFLEGGMLPGQHPDAILSPVDLNQHC